MKPSFRTASMIAFVVVHATSHADDRGIVFRVAPSPATTASEAATISLPAGGEFVYSQATANDRPRIRFAVGAAPRSDFTVFSAEEQSELEKLRQREIAKSASANAPSLTPRGSVYPVHRVAHPRAKVACETKAESQSFARAKWPKVVRDGDRVCVPKLDFAEQGDWRDHLWCFNKGDGSVR